VGSSSWNVSTLKGKTKPKGCGEAVVDLYNYPFPHRTPAFSLVSTTVNSVGVRVLQAAMGCLIKPRPASLPLWGSPPLEIQLPLPFAQVSSSFKL